MTRARSIARATLLASVLAVLPIATWFARTRGRLPHTEPGAIIGATLTATPEPMITSLQDDGTGDMAGLRVGDRIEAVNGRPTHSLKVLAADLRRWPPGPVDIEVRRGKKMLDIRVQRASGG